MKQKKQLRTEREKPRTCDPYMCERCTDLGNGDFLCTYDHTNPNGILVVNRWDSTKDHRWCKRRNRQRTPTHRR